MIYLTEPLLGIRPTISTLRQVLMVADTRQELQEAASRLGSDLRYRKTGPGYTCPRRYSDTWWGFMVILTPKQAKRLESREVTRITLEEALQRAVRLRLPAVAETRRSRERVLPRRRGRRLHRTA